MPAAANKTQPTKASVAQFIAAIENDTRRADARAIDKPFRPITGERPVLWGPSIIGYGRCNYAYESGREGEMPMIAFSPRKASLVLYIMPGFKHEGAPLARLGKHKIGKSCLDINKLADVDERVLAEIATRAFALMQSKGA